MNLYQLYIPLNYGGAVSVSWIISLWQVQVERIASGLPIPALLGSPHGPNQWFYGAPVVLARIPLKITLLIPISNPISCIRLNISQKVHIITNNSCSQMIF
jgi:hypothetical protein